MVAAASNAPVYTRRCSLMADGSPRCIGAAPPDAQAACGVCRPAHTGQGVNTASTAARKRWPNVSEPIFWQKIRQGPSPAQIELFQRTAKAPLIQGLHRKSFLRHSPAKIIAIPFCPVIPLESAGCCLGGPEKAAGTVAPQRFRPPFLFR